LAGCGVKRTELAVLRLLADGETHSGAAIAEALGVSRAAVWKALRRLADGFGVEVLARRGQGYHLSAPLELFDAAKIRALLPSSVHALIEEIEIHFSIESTNSRLMGLAKAGASGGRVCLAEHQQRGRGRQGRTWVAPFGHSILLSTLWHYPFGPAGLSGLSLATGVAVAEVLCDWGVSGLSLKWPNDVLWRGRKLAGLLIEVTGESHGPTRVVTGLGLNLRIPAHLATAIDQPWVDLQGALGAGDPGRNRLAARLIVALVTTMDRYGREGLEPFLASWESFDLYRGRPVSVLVGGRRVNGRHMGIRADGALRILTDSGEAVFHAGDVTLRSGHAGADS